MGNSGRKPAESREEIIVRDRRLAERYIPHLRYDRAEPYSLGAWGTRYTQQATSAGLVMCTQQAMPAGQMPSGRQQSEVVPAGCRLRWNRGRR